MSKGLAIPTMIFMKSPLLVKALARVTVKGSEDTRWFVA
jgi:hypothetical protein